MSVILIVDDHPGIAHALADIVRFARCEPIVVHSGVAAVEHLASNEVDLVILDDHMPGMSGIDVLRTLQASERPRPPVVMFSASDRSRDVALELGAGHFFLKSEFDELVDLIATQGGAEQTSVA